ncbi:MAG TPA: hypothetical protein VHA33_03965 [Candidatus Angelobacter sp.]|jgi:hypothetical protein|nr:hypothetical protein [Candidatus Angelobacter sp.]
MRLAKRLGFIVLMSSLAFAQTSTTNDAASTSNVAEQLKKLQDAMTEQQKQITQQQQQLQKQQQEMEALRQQLATQQNVSAKPGDASAHIVNASLHNTTANNPTAQPASDAPLQEDQSKDSPLSFRIGGAQFTPGGFMDFTSIFRSTNTGNPGGTNFFAIPFSNTVQGHLTENRFTAQNSRINLKATEKFGANDVTGFVEADFLGNDAANVFVTSNSHTFRLRHYFLDLKRDKWEFLGGQTWSWLNPNRNGLSPYSADVFFSQNVDFNYQVGLTWTRAPQFRVVYHPNENWALGLALENPEQFVGAGEVIFPFAFNAQLGVQFDAANNSGTPNVHPDIIPKIAYDTDLNGKHFHVEAAGLVTTFKLTDIPIGGTSFVSHRKTGGGVEAAANLEIIKNFRLVGNAFISNGGGRYVFGMGPDVVVRPNALGTDLDMSLVHTRSGIGGFEWQATPKAAFYGYYGGAYFQRNAFLDVTNPVPGRIGGFGGTNSPNSANRAIQEGTLGWTQTFWKNPQYGAVQLMTQYSYLTRAPWFVALGAPKNAHLSMGWVNLRYTLP